MEAKKLYESAKEAVVKIKSAVPSYAQEEGMEFALIADENGKTYSAMTNITVENGEVKRIPADVAAFLYMKNAGCMVAKSIVVLSVSDRRILPPSNECFDLMFSSNSANDDCIVVLSSTEQKPLSELRLIGDGSGFLSGFDFDSGEAMEDFEDAPIDEPVDEPEETEEPEAEAESAAEAEEKAPKEEKTVPKFEDNAASTNVISGIKIDESNPFYEAPSDVKPPEAIATIADEQAKAAKDADVDAEQVPLSKEELMKQAKKRKKVAKANFLFKKRK